MDWRKAQGRGLSENSGSLCTQLAFGHEYGSAEFSSDTQNYRRQCLKDSRLHLTHPLALRQKSACNYISPDRFLSSSFLKNPSKRDHASSPGNMFQCLIILNVESFSQCQTSVSPDTI